MACASFARPSSVIEAIIEMRGIESDKKIRCIIDRKNRKMHAIGPTARKGKTRAGKAEAESRKGKNTRAMMAQRTLENESERERDHAETPNVASQRAGQMMTKQEEMP